MKKQYMQPEILAMRVEIPHTLDVSGGMDFWGDEYMNSDTYGYTDD